MIGKPFRPPLLKKTRDFRETVDDNSGEPQVKKRRTSGDFQHEEKLAGPQLIFKTPGISSLPPKPLLAVKNPASSPQATQPSDQGVEGYYNVLWYTSCCDSNSQDRLMNFFSGENLLRKSTRLGMVMAYFTFLGGMPPCKIHQGATWEGPRAIHLCFQALHYRSVGKRWR